ncbi:SDR family oxidoreductase [Pseudonocardia sp. MH-G8]|uniref:SDR family oxidoreductase n=1 Tax=Pseudonocardia sp. MH-G8 TaxID=1854588 RepID=UPI000BA1155E|nr:SDR family oxidoreductase [Pseudonocardia sp. MH-G8]OZM80456.1 short-chain dehydrogenase [Pseudonocardia sp. MH-G8]
MRISHATALVTGAGRGLGHHFVRELLARGAKVYATARNPDSITLEGVHPLALDVTDPHSVAVAAEAAADVDLLVNNAGLFLGATLLGDLDAVRAEMDVNFWGALTVVRAFAPVLAANGGGAFLNVASSIASWAAVPGNSGYAVSKAANWNMSNALRHELAGQRTLVTSLHFSATDTDMLAGHDIPKGDPADVVRAALDGVEADAFEVVADPSTRAQKTALGEDPRESYAELAKVFGSLRER